MSRTPIVPVYNQAPLISPMSSTTFQFPNTPSINRMQDSDGASPLMSSVQTPNTGQSAFFNHTEIEAATAAGQHAGYGGGGGSGGSNGSGHQRSATDPVGSKVYHSASRSSQQFTGFPNTSGLDYRPVHHRPSTNSISTSSGLSSPVDMSMNYRQHNQTSSTSQMSPVQPPPHNYPPFSTTPSGPQQAHQLQGPFGGFDGLVQPHLFTHSSQTHRPFTHHGHTGSIGTPFTPTSMIPTHSHTHIHSHRPSYPGQSGNWQPPFTPIVEQGTPTRPSPHPATPNMMLGQPQLTEVIRHGESGSGNLSPNPVSAPLETGLGEFQQHQHSYHQQHIGHMPEYGSDPFLIPQPHPHQSS